MSTRHKYKNCLSKTVLTNAIAKRNLASKDHKFSYSKFTAISVFWEKYSQLWPRNVIQQKSTGVQDWSKGFVTAVSRQHNASVKMLPIPKIDSPLGDKA